MLPDRINLRESQPSTKGAEHDALINQLAREGTLSQSSLLLTQAPEGTLSKYGIATIKGVQHLPEGVWHALEHNLQHPTEALKTVGMGAGMAVVLKTVLPEGGLAGKVAGAAIGVYFTYKSAEPVLSAYSQAGKAQSMKELDSAGRQIADAGGTFIIDSAIAGAGYHLGAKFSDRVLSSRAMDGFADLKASAYERLGQGANKLTDSLGITAGRPSLETRLNTNLVIGKNLPEGTLKQAVSPESSLEVSIMLKPKASELRIERTLARISSGRQSPLTDAEMAANFSPSQSALTSLNKFASENGLQVKDTNLSSGKVTLAGTTVQFESAFHTKINQYTTPEGMKFRAPESTLVLPPELNRDVAAVLGLDNRFQAHANISRKPLFQANPPKIEADPKYKMSAMRPERKGYLPNQVADAYNFPKDSMGEGQSVAIIQLGGGMDRADNSIYYQKHGLKEPKINIIEVGEAKSSPGHAFDSEVMLDSQVIGAVAPEATQNIVFGTNSEQGFVDAISRATFPEKGEKPNSVISISWGQYEDGWTKEGLSSMHEAFKKAALKGISIFASAGDDGARDRVSNGKFNAHYPASDPYVTAVGGTRLITDENGKRLDEIVWNNQTRNEIGGGGVSEIFPPQDFQKDVKVPPNANTGRSGRGFPDIAGNSDPRTGYIIRTHGVEELTGGTSAAAPLYAALMLRINGAMDKPFTGSLNHWLYQNKDAGFFNDITVGDIGPYKAGPGWDATTGLGSINGSKMLEVMKANPTVRGVPSVSGPAFYHGEPFSASSK